MTKISFSDSLSVANDFAVKLLAGFLNMRTDSDNNGDALVEVTHTTSHFTTERMASLRLELSGSQVSRLEETTSETDPDSPCSTNELRHITVFARDRENRNDALIAIFDVHRDHLDGENAEGWTRWKVKNVYVFLTDIGTELVPKYLNRDDREPIWGTRIL